MCRTSRALAFAACLWLSLPHAALAEEDPWNRQEEHVQDQSAAQGARECADRGGTYSVNTGDCEVAESGAASDGPDAAACGWACKILVGSAVLAAGYYYCQSHPAECGQSPAPEEGPSQAPAEGPRQRQAAVDAAAEEQGARDEIGQRIVSFLKDYHEMAATNTRQLGRFYADYVNYGETGVVSRRRIMKEKAGVETACPIRRYDVDYGSLQFQPNASGADLFDVAFDVDTACRGGRKETQRVWRNLLILDLSHHPARIVAARGTPKRSDR